MMLNKVHNSTKYVNIPDDCLDTRIPLFSDDAFRQGIVYEAKYIGSMDVARPQNRLEIVSAMRRIRFEFKAKAVKKERIYFKISTDGVFVNLRTKKKTPIKLRLSQSFNLLNTSSGQEPGCGSSTSSSCTPGLLLMHHPIYRIFYVSHDSQDLKIFSYIARDSKSTNFKCNVFKALRKMEAMKIVRTVGQAFDVCHRLSQKNEAETKSNSEYNTGGGGGSQNADNDGIKSKDGAGQELTTDGENTNDTITNGDGKEAAVGKNSNKENIIDKNNNSTTKVISASQSAQPIRSADLIKITDDDEDEDDDGNRSDSQSESMSTLEDLLGANLWGKTRKKNKSVPNSLSEPSIKSHTLSNGLFNLNNPNSSPIIDEASRRMTCFDNTNFLSSYIFLNYLITKQLSELSASTNNIIPPSGTVNSSPHSTQLPISPSFSGVTGATTSLHHHLSLSQTTKVSTTQLQLLKSQLEEEIKFRVMCQSQINHLSSKNRQLSRFIQRTFEEIRHNQCESCMMRLSTLDVSTNETSVMPPCSNTITTSIPGTSSMSSLLQPSTSASKSLLKPSSSNFESLSSFSIATSSNIFASSKLPRTQNGSATEERDPFICDPIDNIEKEIPFSEIDFYRKIDDSIQRNFYKMASWDKSVETNHHNNHQEFEFNFESSTTNNSTKKEKISNNASRCTSQTSIATNLPDDPFTIATSLCANQINNRMAGTNAAEGITN